MTMRLIFRAFVEWATFLKEFALLGKVWVEACAGVLKELREIWYIIMPLASAGGLGGEHKNIVLLRLVRALKALRAIRMVRTLRLFTGLRLLVKACQCFLPSLGWSMVLLGVFMSMGALVLGTLLQVPEAWFGDWGNRSSYLAYSCSMPSRICFPDLLERKRGIEKNALSFSPLDRRRSWKIQLRMLALPAPVWMRYGTAYRALYTLYEITFAGRYITIIVFAVIRVISAIFLKDTLDAANNDAEHLVVERLRKKAEYVEKLEQVFHAMDDSGDGMITEERLTNILANPVAKAYFQTLDVDIYESAALFHLLDNGDGEVTLEEFIEGIMRCKGQARAIDQALGWCAGVLLCRMLKSSGLISTPSLSHKEEGREWVCKQVFSTFVKSTLIPEVDDDDDTASRIFAERGPLRPRVAQKNRELFIEAVNFPARFTLEDGRRLHWDVADYADKPLELLGSLLQEDICIMHEDLVGGEPTHVFAAGVVMDSFDPVSKHLQAFEGVPGNNRSWFAAQVRICTNIAAKAS
ncbi:hypothetical protein AK812_SmicGene1705 [Symbiodinium microadriaticum]|uniref:EF-hand domain-containing protein n=1 Tax=Symbiodinium microadriaticum TaxID=2951 RepID=A0A1Q9F3H1_SYMMI|nr:hypothetical protein AK812_SmicGene1705 [Symbiodinium microadriaticum]